MRFPTFSAQAAIGLSAALGAALLPAGTAQAELQYRVLAVTGETAPGTGLAFADLHAPRINDRGQVAFFAKLANGDSVLYRSVYSDPSALQLILRTGLAVPGGPGGAKLGAGTTVNLNEDGDMGFLMSVTGLGEAFDDGVFRHRGGTLETVALSGGQVPGAAAGVEYGNIFGPSMNAQDSLAFQASLVGTGVTPGNDSAILAHGIGGLNIVVREGFGAPGRPGDTFGSFGSPGIADNGRLGFFSFLNQDSDQGSIWTGWPGLLSDAMVAGEGVPSVDAFLNFSLTREHLSILTYAPTGFMRDLGEGLENVLTMGDAGPIGTYAMVDQFHGSMNDEGTLYFAAEFNGPAEGADTALVRVRPNGQETVILREGGAAPGYWGGVEIADLANQAARIQFDDAGRLYSSVPLRGAAIHAGNDRALFAHDLDGSVEALMREGQIMFVREGDARIVQEFFFLTGSGTQGGRRGAVNELGDFAMAVIFNDGSEAIVVAQIGTPCSSDINRDGFIDVSDLIILLGHWGQTTPIGEDGDTDRDGDVDVSDLIKLLSDWGVCA